MSRPDAGGRPRARNGAGFSPAEAVLVVALLGAAGAVLAVAAPRGGPPQPADAGVLTAGQVVRPVAGQMLDDIRGARTVGSAAGPACPGTDGSDRVFWTATVDAEGAPVIAAYHVEPGTGTAPDSLLRSSCPPLRSSLGEDIDAVITTVGLADEDTLPAAALLTVGDEIMAVDPATAGTPTLRVVRYDRPTPHQAGEPVAALWTLAAPLAADDPDPVLHLTDAAGLPAAGPYQLLVGGEVVTVDGGYGTKDLGLAERPVPVDHPVGDRVRAQGHEVGRPLAQWPGEPRLAAALGAGAGAATLTLAGGSGLPAATPYGIVVDDEPMTVTSQVSEPGGPSRLSVQRAAPAEHGPGAVVAVGSPLLGGLVPDATSAAVADARGLPAEAPFRIRVGAEPMIVTALTDLPGPAAALTVRRGRAAGDHVAGALVRYEPGAVLVCDGRFECGAEVLAGPVHELDRELHVLGGGELLPADGQRYDVVAGDEVMTVTGRSGGSATPTLAVRRAAPRDHGGRSVVVRHAPRTIDVLVPVGARREGLPATAITTITRRPA